MHTSLIRRRTLLALALPFALAACGSGAPSTATAPPRAAESPSPTVKGDGSSLHDQCFVAFTRMRECTNDYIPALVDLRVRLDVPAGIAATDTEIGRDALVARALAEWSTDSTDAALQATCEGIVGHASPDEQDGMRQVALRCGATDGCEAFVACILPSMEAHLHAGR